MMVELIHILPLYLPRRPQQQQQQIRWVEQQKVLSRKKRDNSKSKFRYSKPMNDPIYSDMWYMV